MIGQTLLHFEITAKLGEGGMGEVWLAEDTRLDRSVAIKVLPQEVAEDPERLARFDREAKLLAALNHPNIASIYEVGEDGGESSVRFLVMELVEGPTLAERLEQGAIPLDEAITIALQIAEALEEAHEKGVVHRDLKPQNIKLTPEGKVKVLDFGLAKAVSTEDASSTSGPNLTQSPTITQGGTAEGVILGTAAYMSPEQAKGMAVDKRADIWAFGVILFEILTGQRLFAASSAAETFAFVITREPDFDALPTGTPPRLRRLLYRCLERDPKQRLRDIGEARVALAALAAGEPDPLATIEERAPGPRSRSALIAALIGVAILSGVLAWLGMVRTRADNPASLEVTEFSFPVDGLSRLQLSPDGRRLAWTARNADGSRTLWVRDLERRTAKEVTRDAQLEEVFWSPDSSELAVEIGTELWRISVADGERHLVCSLPEIEGISGRHILDGAWLPDGTLVFAAWRGGVYRAPASGGSPEIHVPIDPDIEVDFHQIVPLPDGESFVLSNHLHDDAGEEAADRQVLLYKDNQLSPVKGLGNMADHAPISYFDGTLYFYVWAGDEANSVVGMPFDAQRGTIGEDRSVVVRQARRVSIAGPGTLAYSLRQEQPETIVRVDRTGTETSRFGEPHPRLDRPAMSPDGSRLAVVLNDVELWVHDLHRNTLTQLVREDDSIEDPQWSPDGRVLYYSLSTTSRFRRIRAAPGAAPETVIGDAERAFLAPDGSGLLIRTGDFRLSQDAGLLWAPFDSSGRLVDSTLVIRGRHMSGRIGPGKTMIAYSRVVDGVREAFLSSFPAADQTLQLSSSGGGTPQWHPAGGSVFYLADQGLVEVQVGFGPDGQLVASPENRLFDLEAAGVEPGGWTVDPDGGGFVFVKSLATDTADEVVVARNALTRSNP